MLLLITGHMTCNVGDDEKEIQVVDSSDDDFIMNEPKVN